MPPLAVTVRRLVAAPNPLRALWLAVPLATGPSVAAALDGAAHDVRTTASALAWTGWAVALVAVFVPRTSTLTVARLVVPGGPAVATWAASAGAGSDAPGDPSTSTIVIGVVTSLAAVVALWHPATTDAFVDGSSYGSERRLGLRTPTAVAAGPGLVLWAATAAAVVAGPLLVADGRPGPGFALGSLGAVGLVVTARSFHTLSRRWLVFVPAGIVVHDPLVLAEPVLFQRHLLAGIGIAPGAGRLDAVDVTGGALGLALEIRSRQPFSLGVRRGRGSGEVIDVSAVLVVPARPAATLDAARANRVPVLEPGRASLPGD